jgi:hypothetical protein
MIVPTPTISSFEAAVLLYCRFGEYRAWPDFLADCNRGHQSIDGLVLLPCARKQGVRAYQTRYSVADVRSFIEAVAVVIPKVTSRPPAKSIMLAIDTGKPWRQNTFDRQGGAVCRRVLTGAGAHSH